MSLNYRLLLAAQAAGATATDLGTALRQALVLSGASPSTTDLNALWASFLGTQGYTSGSLNDRLAAYLVGKGYSGSLNDMLLAAATAGTLFGSSWTPNDYDPGAPVDYGTVWDAFDADATMYTGMTPGSLGAPAVNHLDPVGLIPTMRSALHPGVAYPDYRAYQANPAYRGTLYTNDSTYGRIVNSGALWPQGNANSGYWRNTNCLYGVRFRIDGAAFYNILPFGSDTSPISVHGAGLTYDAINPANDSVHVSPAGYTTPSTSVTVPTISAGGWHTLTYQQDANGWQARLDGAAVLTGEEPMQSLTAARTLGVILSTWGAENIRWRRAIIAANYDAGQVSVADVEDWLERV